jgi:hypothetical protein
MNKLKYVVLFVFISNVMLFGQTLEELKSQALVDAKATSKATLEKNFDLVLKHTYPAVVELMGGKESATKTIEDMYKTMESQGFVFEKADVVFVSDVVFEQNQYRCYTYSNNQMKMNNMRIFSKSYLFGMYNENEKLWSFIEASKMKNEQLMAQLFPGFKTNMKIPDDETRTEEIKD